LYIHELLLPVNRVIGLRLLAIQDTYDASFTVLVLCIHIEEATKTPPNGSIRPIGGVRTHASRCSLSKLALAAATGLPGGATVLLRRGSYALERPLQLTARDSGRTEARITYRGYEKERVVLTGGRVVVGFERLTDAAVLARLDPAIRDQILRADL
jgi:hypothetical protein